VIVGSTICGESCGRRSIGAWWVGDSEFDVLGVSGRFAEQVDDVLIV